MIPALKQALPATPVIRQARVDDIPLLNQLMWESVCRLGSQDYSQQQLESALKYIFEIDRALVEAGTYFVADVDGEIAGSGGWDGAPSHPAPDSFKASYERAHMSHAQASAHIRAFFVHPRYARQGIGRSLMRHSEKTAWQAGFRRLELISTLTGESLYAKCGFCVVERLEAVLPDGVTIQAARMEKQLSSTTLC